MANPRRWPALDLDARGDTSGADLEDRLLLVLDDCDVIALEPAGQQQWRIYCDTAASRDALVAVLTQSLPLFELTPVDVEDEGWAVKVQQSLGPVRAGGFIVAPPWDSEPDDAMHRIVIEPSMGFGTGHHQSTRLCLQLLERCTLADVDVIDVGTGSGVLAIAASQLGARHVAAIDYDADAVVGARDNVRRNRVDARVSVAVADVDTWRGIPAPVVVANLTAFLLRRYGSALQRMVASGGCLVLSGFTADQVPLVLDAFTGWTTVERLDEDDWVGLRLTR